MGKSWSFRLRPLLIAGLQDVLGRLQNGQQFANEEQRAGDQDWIVEVIGKVQGVRSGVALGG
jgi:hypothetical protein